MSKAVITKTLESSVSRRRIVGTGVKLAYAAPVVAASFKLNAAAAQTVSVACIAGECGAPVICGGEGTCACRNVARTTACLQDEFCGDTSKCSTDSECPGGWCFPAADNCCDDGNNYCVFPCGVHPDRSVVTITRRTFGLTPSTGKSLLGTK